MSCLLGLAWREKILLYKDFPVLELSLKLNKRGIVLKIEHFPALEFFLELI